MDYMLLIVEPPDQRQQRSEAQGRKAYDDMLGFAAELQREGRLQAAQSLKSLKSAARVTRQSGKTQVLDGPFAEAKEMIGGFFLVNCESRAEALAIAARCPASAWCTVEVRELGPCFDDSIGQG